MLRGARVLVVVPARGGSKGVPLKNLRLVAGRPLVSRVGDLVRELDWVDRAVVSTDHLVTADAARDSGLEAPFLRPVELSGDRVGDLDVLVHALQATEADDGLRYDVLVMLQPTSPLRRPGHVTATVEKLLTEGLDAVWTLSPTDLKAHPLKQLRLDAAGHLQYWDERGADIIARQQLTPVYHRNGVAYAVRRECLLEQRSLLGRRSGAVIIEEPMISIDTEEDIARVEALLEFADPAGGPRSPATPQPAAPQPAAPQPPAPKKLVVDIDGVLAGALLDGEYQHAPPLADNIARVNALYDSGCHITLFTARGSATGIDWSEVTRQQLAAWGVRYHALKFGKPPADYYVDDRLLTLGQAVALCGLADPAQQE